MNKEKIKILLAEDDSNLGSLLKSYLEAKGYVAYLCVNGIEAYNEYLANKYDFLILDVMMPLKDGFTLAKEIRNIDKNLPILFLTAKTLEIDVIEGFKIGADDYLTKPFSMEELLMRISAILRRADTKKTIKTNGSIFKIASFVFDYNHQTLVSKDDTQKLTSKEADLLKLLCENINEELDRAEALKKIWNNDSYFNARSMDVYITKLRKILKADPNIELLNIHGKGFKLVIS